jgi:hypothetical protein
MYRRSRAMGGFFTVTVGGVTVTTFGRFFALGSSTVSNRNKVSRAGEVVIVPCKSLISATGGAIGSSDFSASVRTVCKVTDVSAITP